MNIIDNYKVNTISECTNLLSKYKAKIIAGGTDIIIKLSETHEEVSLIDISSVKELKFVKRSGSTITIGANTTFSEIIKHKELLPSNINGFIEAIKSIGSPQIRNAATIGGNICNGSPAADSVPPLIALKAKLKIISIDKERNVNIEDFFLGKGKVDLKDNELLESISFDIPKGNLNFYKYGLRNAVAITLGSIAALIELDQNHIKNIVIASGAFAPFCKREIELEEFLNDKELNDETLREFLEFADNLILNRVSEFDSEFKDMKSVTMLGALKHVIGGKS